MLTFLSGELIGCNSYPEMNNLEKIRAACIKANPEKVWSEVEQAGSGRYYTRTESIRLADVIYAYSQTPGQLRTWSAEKFKENVWQIIVFWNLRLDDITLQTQETQDFIASLL